MGDELLAILSRLAARRGAGPIDASDEHARWNLYVQVLESTEETDLLLDAVVHEPDRAVALSLVLRAIETGQPDRRMAWVGRLQEGRERDYATARTRDLAILDAAQNGTLEIDDAAAPEGAWSDWLQRRLAESGKSRKVLQRLATRGRTKRVRNTAAHRLAGMEG